jgi:two-component system nitrate/nitrite sensor histidine kinase NarX
VTTQPVGRLRADPIPDADRAASRVPAGASEPPERPQPSDDQDLRAVLEPMLDAVVRMAGATAGTIAIIDRDGARYEVVANVGAPSGKGGLSAWCPRCDDSRSLESACVKSALCGHDERIPADTLGAVCRHVVAVPLRHRDRPVGALHLQFAQPCTLPAAMTPLLRATGDLVGTALDNARLSRENLRIRLTSERQMLANEVHDSLAQGLTYMRMRMSLLRDAIRQNDELRAHKYSNDVDDTLESSQRRLRELITYYRSQMDPQGLLHALSETSERFLDRTGISLEFVNHVPDLKLAPEREIEVFHIVQEALANISRHARATHARLTLACRSGDYVIVVEDDGVGLAAHDDSPDSGGHYGIAIMRERARRLGGTAEIAAAGRAGTRLELTFPITTPRDEAFP